MCNLLRDICTCNESPVMQPIMLYQCRSGPYTSPPSLPCAASSASSSLTICCATPDCSPSSHAVQIRQALHRSTQRPARLLNNALDEGISLNLNEADKAPAHLAAPTMLPGEDRIRFWMKERSLLAVALHVKPGMTRAAEFLVPVQLCNRALSLPWPAGVTFFFCFQSAVKWLVC